MSFLLDTNTVSELTKPNRDPAVLAWLNSHHQDRFISAVTVAELVKGVKKRRRIERELRFLQEDYWDRILPFDELTAIEWGRLYAAAKKKNRILALEDSVIEALALNHELAVVTHNASDFFRARTVDP